MGTHPIFESDFDCLTENKMSEFWVSQGRVFCEYCKCWYADNKVEKETHERGSKHQENQAKHLAGIRKLSEWNAKEQDKIECYLAEADRAAKEAFKRDLKEAGINAKSIRRQERDERKEKEEEETRQIKEAKNWHQAKDAGGNIYYWNSKTRETRWKAPPNWEEAKKQEKEAEPEGNATIVVAAKPSFKKSGRSLFNSSAGTNSSSNSTTAGLKKNSIFAKTLSWKGANDDDRGKKRSNDVAYGTWVPDKSRKQEEVKTEFKNDLGLPDTADAFYENEANDQDLYKGFTVRDARFEVGKEASVSCVGEGDSSSAVPFKRKKFSGNTRRKFD